MDWFFRIMFFILGAVFGSFVNMLSYRSAVAYKLKRPKFKVLGQSRSVCDFCGRKLRWWENLPVVSFLLLGGKSNCCRRRLPLTYPIVEAGTGLLFLLVFWNFALGEIRWPVVLIETIILVMLSFSMVFDSQYMLLPDFSNLILAAAAALMLFFRHDYLSYLISALGSVLFLGMLHVATKGKGMGMGDVKFSLFMGLFLGWQRLILAYYVAFIAGAAAGLGLIAIKKAGRKSEIAFGPFLAAGVLTAWIFGGEIIGRLGLYF